MKNINSYTLPRRAYYRTNNVWVIVHCFGFLGGVSRALIEFDLSGQLLDVDAYLLTMEKPSDKIPKKVEDK